MGERVLTLEGSTFPLPEWIEEAVLEGTLEIRVTKAGYEVLKGQAKDPTGRTVTFGWRD